MIGSGDSTFYKKVMNSKETNKWKIATQEELKSLHMNETWTFVELPKGEKAIGCKFFGIRKLYPKKMGKNLRSS